MKEIGNILFLLGAIAMLAGIILYFAGDSFSWLGHLPGDIRVERNNFRFYFPLTSAATLFNYPFYQQIFTTC